MQKYLHDLDAWNALSTEDQERVIGRSKLSDIEMPDDVKPINSHVALNTIEEPDGTERQILRANMPFGELGRGEFGTYYIAYAATPSVTELMLTHMFIGNPPGNTDRILDFSTAVTGSLFFVPSADFLDDLPDPPGAAGAAGAAGDSPARSGGEGRFPRYWLLEEERTMNNLHRELAPVSDAAWASIEAEARRTFEQHVAGRRVVDVTGPDGPTLASVGTGHLAEIEPPGGDAAGILAWLRSAQQLVELRVPFTVSRLDVDERGARRAGPGLAAGQGRGPADRLRRGPGDLRRLPGRRDHRGQAEHVQPGPHAARPRPASTRS